jgi:hypothetical protein
MISLTSKPNPLKPTKSVGLSDVIRFILEIPKDLMICAPIPNSFIAALS